MGSVGSQRLKESSVAGTPDRSVVTSLGFEGLQLEARAAAEAARDQGLRARGILMSMNSGE